MSAIGHELKPPPECHELPSARLLHHPFLIFEAEQVQDPSHFLNSSQI